MRTAEFLAMVESVRREPEDDGIRWVAADWLDEFAPATPVNLHHVPDWLRLAWLRAVRLDIREGRGAKPPWALSYRHTAGWSVAREMDRFEDARDVPHACRLDHWGSTSVAGVTAFVTEPYCAADQLPLLLRELAGYVGGVNLFARASEWGHGTYRGLLVPAVPASAAGPAGRRSPRGTAPRPPGDDLAS